MLTAFYAVLCVTILSAASIAQRIQRAKAKETIEIVRIIGWMAGEKFTGLVREKRIGRGVVRFGHDRITALSIRLTILINRIALWTGEVKEKRTINGNLHIDETG